MKLSAEMRAALQAAAEDGLVRVDGGFWFPAKVAAQAPRYNPHLVGPSFYDRNRHWSKGTIDALVRRGLVEQVVGKYLYDVGARDTLTTAGRSALEALQ